MEPNALVTDIQRFSIHDGPGIRTSIFFKGCDMACAWCHNPANIRFTNELVYSRNECILCGDCKKICVKNAIQINEDGVNIDPAKCDLCLKCTDACPTTALSPAAKSYDAVTLVKNIARDMEWHKDTGGITLTGGEPLLHASFLAKFLPMIKGLGIHVAVETAGYWRLETVIPIAGMIDLFMFDVKIMDEKKHLQYTGKSNKRILENLRALFRNGNAVQVRMPVIPNVNDTADNLDKTCSLLKSLGMSSIIILPYHKLGEEKLLKIKSCLKPLETPSMTKEELEKTKAFFKRRGIEPREA